jgi:hypothetical protein
MRKKSLLAVAVAVIAAGLAAPTTADAFGWSRHSEPEGWGRLRTIRHWVYYPRYTHVTLTHAGTDPYAYRYEPRGYYPFYNSGYWTKASEMRARRRARFIHPPYHSAWGSSNWTYEYVDWRYRYHDRRRHGHW